MKPNLFDIATKELHQDAFIVWLLKWADPENKQYDERLHSCGQEFIRQLISAQHQQTISTITKVDAGRQWENIDIWAEVYTPGKNYLIIIEDKTISTEHSNQLETYKKTGEDFCAEKEFILVCVYIKTGSEPERDLKAIRLKGFSTINRQEFLTLLDKYDDISNNIFKDFTHRLINLEATYNAYENIIINDWTDQCWIGFYQFLEKEIGLIAWHYVNPPSGDGFWNATLNWLTWNGFPVYLQIEQGKLCFKIATHPEEIDVDYEFDRSEVRNKWNIVILSKATIIGLNEIRKPDKFGTGNYMTAAVVDRDIWLGNGNSIIIKSEVVERLNKYKEFLIKCLD